MANLLTDRPVILASASPRRLMLLRQVGINPQVIPVEVQELKPRPRLAAEDLTLQNAKLKALTAKNMVGKTDAWIIAADTVVSINKMILGKPKDTVEACKMLRILSGRWHRVLTGLCLIDAQTGNRISGCSIARVLFENLSDQDILSYVKTGEPKDKAGAYGMQGQGALFVNRIEGDYSTVVGLSLPMLRIMMNKISQPKEESPQE